MRNVYWDMKKISSKWVAANQGIVKKHNIEKSVNRNSEKALPSQRFNLGKILKPEVQTWHKLLPRFDISYYPDLT